MSTFNQFLDDQHERQDAVGQISRYWRGLLPGRPRVHAPTGVLNHLRTQGAAFTTELQEAFNVALREYQERRAPQGSKLLTGDQDPAQTIVSLGQIADAFRDVSRRLSRTEAYLAAICAKLGVEVDPSALVPLAAAPEPVAITQAIEVSEPLSADEWTAAAQAADWTATDEAAG